MHRSRVALLCAVLLLSTVAVLVAKASTAADDRPPGVPAKQWQAFTPDLGLYYTPVEEDVMSRRTQGERVRGVFMARLHGRWVTVQPGPTSSGPFLLDSH
jgi:hypothetical protein